MCTCEHMGVSVCVCICAHVHKCEHSRICDDWAGAGLLFFLVHFQAELSE